MLIEKIKIDNLTKNSNVTIFFCGNKEEVILEDNRVLIWCQEEDSYEKWLSLDVMDSRLLKKYLSNKLTLLNLIENSNLSLYKRYYEKYDELVLDSKINLDDAIEMNLILPNDKAVLGYNFLDKYNNQICYFTNYNVYNDDLTNTCEISIMQIQNNITTEFSEYFNFPVYQEILLERKVA